MTAQVSKETNEEWRGGPCDCVLSQSAEAKPGPAHKAQVVQASFSVRSTLEEAEEYTVRAALGWTSVPPGGASFYSKWTQNFTFKLSGNQTKFPNDNSMFNFESGSHTVALLTKANYDKCNVNDYIQNFNTGPGRITLNSTGEFYFTFTFSGHCSSGQKLRVEVTSGGSSSSPVPRKAPAEGPSSPPPQGSATPLAATFSVLHITIALNFCLSFKTATVMIHKVLSISMSGFHDFGL
ncbi:early nodulin-like protein 15 [Lotus japonicus]|uniref:early nodulin-like protein 15 n=1 Tax=Lotus japonicus TaxID=34305 RepID=UPI002583734C|nr:early nodulin-like protein 15 [Lotus japonicus]